MREQGTCHAYPPSAPFLLPAALWAPGEVLLCSTLLSGELYTFYQWLLFKKHHLLGKKMSCMVCCAGGVIAANLPFSKGFCQCHAICRILPLSLSSSLFFCSTSCHCHFSQRAFVSFPPPAHATFIKGFLFLSQPFFCVFAFFASSVKKAAAASAQGS